MRQGKDQRIFRSVTLTSHGNDAMRYTHPFMILPIVI